MSGQHERNKARIGNISYNSPLGTRQMSNYFSDISSLILEFTNFYHTKILNAIVNSEDYVDEPKRFIYVICRKTKDVTEALNIYIRNFDNRNHYQISIYILLRSILSDIIVSEYVILFGKNDDERKKIIESIYIDHVDKTYKSIEKTYKKINNYSAIEIESIKEEFRKKKPKYFDSDDNIAGSPLRTSPEKLINEIFSKKPQNEEYGLLKLAFHYYDMFSKYEHLGDLSFSLIHRVYDPATKNERWSEIYESINIIMSVLINYTNCWNDKFIKEREELEFIQTIYSKKIKPSIQ